MSDITKIVYVKIDASCREFRCFECRPSALEGPDNDTVVGLRSDLIKNVTLYGQCNSDEFSNPDHNINNVVYGVDVHYNDGGHLGMVEWKMTNGLKVLKGINAKLRKIESTAGPAATFGAHVQRFAAVVGATHVTIDRDHRSREVTGLRYETVRADQSANMIDNILWSWLREARSEHSNVA